MSGTAENGVVRRAVGALSVAAVVVAAVWYFLFFGGGLGLLSVRGWPELGSQEDFDIFKGGVDWDLTAEVNGQRVQGGGESWTEYWAKWIYQLRDQKETSNRYVQYVVDARKRAGLSDLPKEAFRWSPQEKPPTVLPDTGTRWRAFTRINDGHVSAETAGSSPPGNAGSWFAYWFALGELLNANQTNAERYLQYIVDARKNGGLPALPRDALELTPLWLLADTPTSFERFSTSVDAELRDEARGGLPGSGSWNRHWAARIGDLRGVRQNSANYVLYIIEARRRAGLSPLPPVVFE